jgi:hypothetical protein
MSRIKVKDYATLNNITVQSVYKRINKGDLEVQEIDKIKYIIIDDLIDFEKKFNELQLKYNGLIEVNELQLQLIQQFKDEKKLFGMLLEKPKNMEYLEVKEIKPKKKKKKLSKKDKKKLKKKDKIKKIDR